MSARDTKKALGVKEGETVIWIPFVVTKEEDVRLSKAAAGSGERKVDLLLRLLKRTMDLYREDIDDLAMKIGEGQRHDRRGRPKGSTNASKAKAGSVPAIKFCPKHPAGYQMTNDGTCWRCWICGHTEPLLAYTCIICHNSVDECICDFTDTPKTTTQLIERKCPYHPGANLHYHNHDTQVGLCPYCGTSVVQF